MIERVARRFGLQPQRLVGNTVYGAVSLLKWLVDRHITPHIPVATDPQFESAVSRAEVDAIWARATAQ